LNHKFIYFVTSVGILKLNVNSIIRSVNVGVRRLWFPYIESCSFINSSDIHKTGCCVPSNCWHFVYKPWTIRVCSRRLYLFLKVRLQNWQTAVGMPMCCVRMWRRRLPTDKTEGQCGQYSVPTGGKGTGVPSNAVKNNG